MSDLRTDALLLLAAVGGGALNSVVGGGSFLTFPALLFSGIAPVAANVTSTLALWPAAVASTFAYRRHLAATRRLLPPFGAASLVGGVAGSLLLLGTDNALFAKLVPCLLLVATLIFTFGPRVVARLKSEKPPPEGVRPWTVGAQLLIGVYGGYFGGGMGILMLALYSVMGMSDILAMNALRNLLATIINGVALVAFVASGTIVWREGAIMLAGATLGGYGGAVLATRANPKVVRAGVTVVAWALTTYFFVKEFFHS